MFYYCTILMLKKERKEMDRSVEYEAICQIICLD